MDVYGWIKAFHIIAVIAWMAGMLYLPRLFVYQCAAEKGSVQSETFKVMGSSFVFESAFGLTPPLKVSSKVPALTVIGFSAAAVAATTRAPSSTAPIRNLRIPHPAFPSYQIGV